MSDYEREISAAVNKIAQNLNIRAEALTQKEESLKSREISVAASESALVSTEAALKDKAKAVQSRENKLKEKEDFDSRVSRFNAYEASTRLEIEENKRKTNEALESIELKLRQLVIKEENLKKDSENLEAEKSAYKDEIRQELFALIGGDKKEE